MRFFSPRDAIIATQLTSRFPFNHGAPCHISDPKEIGVDLRSPIVGKPIQRLPRGRVPVFWACGVTPQQAALESAVEWMITHKPGHGFITDLRADQVCIP
jgi:uncharacterized protein YcsI (UPF0317 family)